MMHSEASPPIDEIRRNDNLPIPADESLHTAGTNPPSARTSISSSGPQKAVYDEPVGGSYPQRYDRDTHDFPGAKTHLQNRGPQQQDQQSKFDELKAQHHLGRRAKSNPDNSPVYEHRSIWQKLLWFMLFPPLLGESTADDVGADHLVIPHPWRHIGRMSRVQRTENEVRRETICFLRRCLAEMFGTFVLVFSHAALKVQRELKNYDPTGSALASGVSVSAIIYAFGPMSGAHVNPAVSFAFFLRRAFPGRWVIAYWLNQFFGAVLAGAMLRSFFDTQTEAQLGASFPDNGFQFATIFWAEAFCSSILFVFVLSVSKKGGLQGANSGLAVGFTLFWILLFRTDVGSGSLNPFRSLGVALVNGPIDDVWPYVAGPFCGSCFAALFVWIQFGNVSEEELQKAQGLGRD